MKSTAGDKSWRMRYVLADKIVDLAKCLGPEMLIEIFINFLQDPEGEVKVITVSRSSEFCKFMNSSAIIANVIPHLEKLSTDTLMPVRST